MSEESTLSQNLQTMSSEIGTLAGALAKAQGEMKAASKDSKNPFYDSKYASLASVWDAVREPLSKNGLAVIQTTDGDSLVITVLTTLAHSSGQWIKGILKVKPSKTDPQGIGSALSYARRYALSAIVGVAVEDDDAEGATDRVKKDGNKNQNSQWSSKSKLKESSSQQLSPNTSKTTTSTYRKETVENKLYILVDENEFFDAQTLINLGMSLSANVKNRYYAPYSSELEKNLESRLAILMEVSKQ